MKLSVVDEKSNLLSCVIRRICLATLSLCTSHIQEHDWIIMTCVWQLYTQYIRRHITNNIADPWFGDYMCYNDFTYNCNCFFIDMISGAFIAVITVIPILVITMIVVFIVYCHHKKYQHFMKNRALHWLDVEKTQKIEQESPEWWHFSKINIYMYS